MGTEHEQSMIFQTNYNDMILFENVRYHNPSEIAFNPRSPAMLYFFQIIMNNHTRFSYDQSQI